jgi:uncharacterized protein YciI
MPYFIVISEQGTGWNPARSMRDQVQWSEHASFMNSLVDAGFVILGGPLKCGSTHRARLIVRAESESDVRNQLAQDPWARSNLLKTLSVEAWEVLLSKGE